MPVQSMEIGVTTELGQHVRNSAEEVARLEEEPATTLLQRLEEKTVKGSLWNLDNAILTLVQVRKYNQFLRYFLCIIPLVLQSPTYIHIVRRS